MTTSPIITRLTILFDPPFWVGVYEVECDARLWVGRWVFGSEPSSEEVYLFILHGLDALRARMTLGVPAESRPAGRLSFKRMQREIRRAEAQPGIGTKSQEAIKEQIAQGKIERRKSGREERDAAKAHKRDIAREKAKARHKGRG